MRFALELLVLAGDARNAFEVGRHWPDGQNVVVRSEHPHLFGMLCGRGGGRRHQMGDLGMRTVIPTEALEQAARVATTLRTGTLAPEDARRRGFKPARKEPSGRSER